MKNESSGFALRFPWMCCEGHKFGNQVLWVPSKGFYKGVHRDNEKENGSYYLRCIIRVFQRLGYPFGGPHNKVDSILGSISGSLYFGKLPGESSESPESAHGGAVGFHHPLLHNKDILKLPAGEEGLT